MIRRDRFARLSARLLITGLVLFPCGCGGEEAAPAGRDGTAPRTAAGVDAAPRSPADSGSGDVLTTLPVEIDTDREHLFYLHGAIIETEGRRPTHPEFGVYEYDAILDSLTARGFVVISEARERGTDGKAYAGTLAAQIDSLLHAGLPPQRISVVGFSKGGGIAVWAASLLQNPDIDFIFLATCVNWIERWPTIELKGRILSIYEASDPVAGSCSELFAKCDVVPEPVELELHVGGGHGAFYQPRKAWLDPVADWIRESVPAD